MDRFAAKVNIEVQWASEQTIAAVERNGGVITTAYFDIFSVNALSDPKRYFSLGHPVRRFIGSLSQFKISSMIDNRAVNQLKCQDLFDSHFPSIYLLICYCDCGILSVNCD